METLCQIQSLPDACDHGLEKGVEPIFCKQAHQASSRDWSTNRGATAFPKNRFDPNFSPTPRYPLPSYASERVFLAWTA